MWLEILRSIMFYEFIANFKKRNDSEILYLDNLNIEETGNMIKNMLILDYVPQLLAKRILSKSYGNTFFITEIIKELYEILLEKMKVYLFLRESIRVIK